MQIYTGYYSKVKTYAEAGCDLIGVSRGIPKFISCNMITEMRFLAPRGDAIYMKDMDRFSKLYRETILNGLDYKRVIELIENVVRAHGKDKVVLLCYEKDQKQCHRSILGDWIKKESKGKYEVKEFGEVDKKNEPEQLLLFT